MPQLKVYHRPTTLEEALRLLDRAGANMVVLAGGTFLTARLPDWAEEVVDLQALGLTDIKLHEDRLFLGAMVRLQTIVDDPEAPALLRETARRAGPNTLRHAATLGGVIVGADQESELLAALLVFEAEVYVQSSSGARSLPLPVFLRDVPAGLGGGILTGVSMATGGKTARDAVARTPSDTPIVAAVTRQETAGRLHLALCGVANTPVLVDPGNIKGAINPHGDFRGSSEYRRQMAAVLGKRVVDQVTQA